MSCKHYALAKTALSHNMPSVIRCRHGGSGEGVPLDTEFKDADHFIGKGVVFKTRSGSLSPGYRLYGSSLLKAAAHDH